VRWIHFLIDLYGSATRLRNMTYLAPFSLCFA